MTFCADVTSVALSKDDEFIILASDGVFDVFDNEQAVRIARSASTPQAAAELLTSSAFHAGSLDNITAVVVALRGYQPKAGTLAASPAELPARCVGRASMSCSVVCAREVARQEARHWLWLDLVAS